MKQRRWTTMLVGATMLAGCGGSGSSGASQTVATATPTPTATATTSAACTLRARQDWVYAQLKEWWLFPDALAATEPDPTPYGTVSDYLDSLTATARAQGKDRYFTYLTSIASETAYYASGTSAGFGVRLGLDGSNRLFVTESFEGAPALAAGIDRGAQIVAIGTSPSSLQTVASIIATSGSAGITTALGDNNAGVSRALQISDAQGTRVVTLTKTSYDIAPLSSRYGYKIITDGFISVGYVNLRTFITPAEAQLRTAFAAFKAAGINNVIVDLRYNGGGLLSTAVVLANQLGGNRSTSDVIDTVAYRPEKAANNTTDHFAPEASSVSPIRVAFIGTGGTASASELVINAFTPYLHASSGLIGTNTYGKPVGQIALDQSACDDRLRVIAFALQNSAGNGAYYSGLAASVEASCQASDDITYPMGDAREASTRAALDFVEGKPCTRIPAGQTTQALDASRRMLLSPDRPDTAQRETPGLF